MTKKNSSFSFPSLLFTRIDASSHVRLDHHARVGALPLVVVDWQTLLAPSKAKKAPQILLCELAQRLPEHGHDRSISRHEIVLCVSLQHVHIDHRRAAHAPLNVLVSKELKHSGRNHRIQPTHHISDRKFQKKKIIIKKNLTSSASFLPPSEHEAQGQSIPVAARR